MRKPGEICIKRENGLCTVRTQVFLPQSRDVIFAFFANAGNLQILTPPWLQFEILSPMPIEMQAGTLIVYRLRIHGIALRWQSLITAWDPPHRFVDEQKRGPYRKWIHEHVFSEQDGGTEIGDCVRHSVPGGWLFNQLFVQRDVERIFQYRARRLQEIFGDH